MTPRWTFTVRSGGLAISVPDGPGGLSRTPGSTISGPLGTVRVTDLRGAKAVSWTATMSATSFTATGAPAIAASEVTYSGGSGTTTWTPTLQVAVPFTATYGGTVTQSVA